MFKPSFVHLEVRNPENEQGRHVEQDEAEHQWILIGREKCKQIYRFELLRHVRDRIDANQRDMTIVCLYKSGITSLVKSRG